MANKLFLIGIVAGLAGALGLAGLFSALSTPSTVQMMGGNHVGMMGNSMMTTQTSGQLVPWHSTNKAPFGASGISYVDNVQVTGVSITESKQVAVNLRYSGNGTSPDVVLIATTDFSMDSNNGMGMMGGMHSGMMGMGGMDMIGSMPIMGQGMMYGIQNPMWNNTQWLQWHNHMAQWHGQMNDSQWQDMQAQYSQMMTNPGMMGPGMMYGQVPMWNGTAAIWPHNWQQPLRGSTVVESGWNSNVTLGVTLVGDGSAYDTNTVNVMVYPLTS